MPEPLVVTLEDVERISLGDGDDLAEADRRAARQRRISFYGLLAEQLWHLNEQRGRPLDQERFWQSYRETKQDGSSAELEGLLRSLADYCCFLSSSGVWLRLNDLYQLVGLPRTLEAAVADSEQLYMAVVPVLERYLDEVSSGETAFDYDSLCRQIVDRHDRVAFRLAARRLVELPASERIETLARPTNDHEGNSALLATRRMLLRAIRHCYGSDLDEASRHMPWPQDAGELEALLASALTQPFHQPLLRRRTDMIVAFIKRYQPELIPVFQSYAADPAFDSHCNLIGVRWGYPKSEPAPARRRLSLPWRRSSASHGPEL